jgi:hypothetical protein
VNHIDGQASIEDLLKGLGARSHPSRAADIERATMEALRLLYVDGTIAELL